MTSVKQCLDWARQTILQGSNCVEPRFTGSPSPADADLLTDARVLLAHAVERDKSWLYAWPEAELNPTEIEYFQSLMRQRIDQHPVAYLVGHQEFWSLNLKITRAVLIPRADTELLVELTLSHVRSIANPKILELGTGSGAISIALGKERADAEIISTDISIDAVQLARDNAQLNQVGNVTFLQANWFDEPTQLQHLKKAKSSFDIIVSNPPYIEQDDPHLSGDGVRYEPTLALVSGKTGTDALAHLISHSPEWLKTDACLLLEHGYQQGTVVNELLRSTGYTAVETLKDSAGNERVSKGCRPPG